MIWSCFVGTGVTERNNKSTVAKVSRLLLPLRFSWIFLSSVVQKRCSKILRWSIGIEPTLKSMWNTMECERDSFSGARETHRECVSHHLKASFFIENCKFSSNTSIYTLNLLSLWKREPITRNTVEGNAGLTEKVIGSKREGNSGLTGNWIVPGELSVLQILYAVIGMLYWPANISRTFADHSSKILISQVDKLYTDLTPIIQKNRRQLRFVSSFRKKWVPTSYRESNNFFFHALETE